MADPYVYPGTNVLINKFDIRDAKELKVIERKITQQRREELHQLPPNLAKDMQGYQELHKHLFQDVYEWAGEIRTTELSKGSSMFALKHLVEPSLNKEFSALKEQNMFAYNYVEEFAGNAAKHISELNVIHPFREGNGRVMRAHLEQLGRHAGHDVDTSKFDKESWIHASIEGMHRSDVPMEKVIGKAIGLEQEEDTSQGLDQNKQDYYRRAVTAMKRDPELDSMNDYAKMALAANAALEDSKHSDSPQKAKTLLKVCVILIADAQEEALSKNQEAALKPDLELFRDNLVQAGKSYGNSDLKREASKYVSVLNSMAKNESVEKARDSEIELE